MDLRGFVFSICIVHTLFSFSVPYGSVVFSELMIDPEPVVKLPEVEYLEIYNRTDRPLTLNGWTFHYGDKAYRLPDCNMQPHTYGLLCSTASVAQFTSGVLKIPVVGFPALANTEKILYLLDEKGLLVTSLDYSQAWHENGFKGKGGWSLECKDLDNLSGQGSNWTSSIDSRGGTPGSVNSVASSNQDTVLPSFKGLYVLSPSRIEIHFSKSMQEEKLQEIRHFSVSSSVTVLLSVEPLFPMCRSVVLNLGDTLQYGVEYKLALSGLVDVSGLSLKDTLVVFGLPDSPEPKDLGLNEVLFDPVPGGCDYVEFVNVSDRCLDLSQVWLTNRSDSGKINEGIRLSEKPLPCLPGSYWLLTTDADSVLSTNGSPRAQNYINLKSFPSMPDDRGNVALLTGSAQIIDEMAYDADMHFPLMSVPEGVSLEKMHPDLCSSDPKNWRSASSSSGYGTPGYRNSQFLELSTEKSTGFTVPQKWFTPNNDGKEDMLAVNYQVDKSFLANLVIYDMNGRVVRKLAGNELLSTNGSFFWDGTSGSGNRVPFGRYILIVEYFTPYGEMNKQCFVLNVLF